MPEFAAILGQVLADLRKARSLSQEEVAGGANRHTTYVSQLERGLKSPTVRTLRLIADVLGVRVSAILMEAERRADDSAPG